MKSQLQLLLLLSFLALPFAMTSQLRADECGCCAQCGCHNGCHKVCRLVKEEKKVDITCWGCKCEDFCLPCPSTPDCHHCKTVCDVCDDKCDKNTPYAKPKRFVWTEWIPCGATMHTKKKLMKKTVTEKIPSFKWVVEDMCDDCEASCGHVEIPKGAEIPQPPDVDAKLVY